MRRNRDYAVARVDDDTHRLDRATAPATGPIAYIKRVLDRRQTPLGWRLRPLVVMEGSRSKIWPLAAEALTSTKLLTAAEASAFTGETTAAASTRRRIAS
jgi:hypothetical protein